MTEVIIAGALVGTGIWLMATGWSPARAPLHVMLARLGQPVIEIPTVAGSSIDGKVGRLARKIGPVERSLLPMRTDLRILHRSPEEQATNVVMYGLLGFLWAPVVATGCWLAGIRLPFALPLWLAVGGCVLGVGIAIRGVKPEAMKRRRAFSHALSAFCDVCGMSLAAGRGVESSIETAAQAGEGWPFVEMQSALRAGYVRGETPWDALARLGTDTDLADLTELASAISLAADQGAAVRDTVASKSKTIRERLTSDAERSAASVTERMGIPAALLIVGLVIFLIFPSLAVLFQ
jgi:tight adherence protein C